MSTVTMIEGKSLQKLAKDTGKTVVVLSERNDASCTIEDWIDGKRPPAKIKEQTVTVCEPEGWD